MKLKWIIIGVLGLALQTVVLFFTVKAFRISNGLKKGGVSVTLEVKTDDLVEKLAGRYAMDQDFRKAFDEAVRQKALQDEDFVELFIKEYQRQNGKGFLCCVFAESLQDAGITLKSSDDEVKAALDKEVRKAMDKTCEILEQRINAFDYVRSNVQVLEGKGRMEEIQVEVYGTQEPTRLGRVLGSSGNLEFWETYSAKDLQAALRSIDSNFAEAEDGAHKFSVDEKAIQKELSVHPLLARLIQNQLVSPDGCIVGIATSRDTATIMKLLTNDNARKVLPGDVHFAWGVKPSEDFTGNFFELYALKKTNGAAAMAGDVIADAKDDFDQYHNPIVSMTMNTQGSRDWAALTKKNIKRPVAIVLDGFVYSAPVVQNEITGGSSQISGHFTPEDTKDLANVLKSGKMSVSIEIIGVRILPGRSLW